MVRTIFRVYNVKELLAKHGIVLNPATLLLGYWLKKAPSAFGQQWIFLNLGNNGIVPFMGNCGGFPDLANARIICTDI
jgi:hypothetical protein